MNVPSLVQSFAVNAEGRVVSVDEVPRGLDCGCVCSLCNAPLVAKQGEIRSWHFAHASESDCEGAAETALHLAAKQLIRKAMGIMVPKIEAVGSARLADGRHAQATESRPESWMDFDIVLLEQQISLEQPIESIRPDVVGQSGSERVIIEVAVTHFVEPEKSQALAVLDWPAFEIRLDTSLRETWDWKILEDIVIHGTEEKRWIHCPGLADLQAMANAKAYETAMAQIVPPPPDAPPAAPSKDRFVIRGMIVYVSDLPFGITVWSPYHPEVNEKVKNIVKPLGGRWQPKYRNWLLPAVVKPFLLSALAEAARGGEPG
jgi:competence protein CoiA